LLVETASPGLWYEPSAVEVATGSFAVLKCPWPGEWVASDAVSTDALTDELPSWPATGAGPPGMAATAVARARRTAAGYLASMLPLDQRTR
jgi:hypothetical protein